MSEELKDFLAKKLDNKRVEPSVFALDDEYYSRIHITRAEFRSLIIQTAVVGLAPFFFLLAQPSILVWIILGVLWMVAAVYICTIAADFHEKIRR